MNRKEASELVATYFQLDEAIHMDRAASRKERDRLACIIVDRLKKGCVSPESCWEKVAPLRDYIQRLYDSKIAYGPPGLFRKELEDLGRDLIDKLADDHSDSYIAPIDPTWTSRL